MQVLQHSLQMQARVLLSYLSKHLKIKKTFYYDTGRIKGSKCS